MGFSSIFKGISGANPFDPMDLAGTTARKWQEHMSNTAHQREVEDLKAAGLNPVLSATGGGGGASTPSAPSGGGTELGSLIGAITNVKNAQSTAKQVESQKNLNEKQQGVYEAQVQNFMDEIHNRGINTAANVKKIDNEIQQLKAQTLKTLEDAKARANTNAKNEELGLSDLDTGTTRMTGHAIKGQKQIGKNVKLTVQKGIDSHKIQQDNAHMRKFNRMYDNELQRRISKYLTPEEQHDFKTGTFRQKIAIMNKAKQRGYK